MKVQELLSRQFSNIIDQYGYQSKATVQNTGKISLLNSKKERKEADRIIHK
jgi:hypothetical protein